MNTQIKQENKKPRVMSIKGFLHKSTTKAANSASGFISQYREFLTTGSLAEVTTPILVKLDAGELMPTPALQEIRNVALQHMLQLDVQKAVAEITSTEEIKEPGTSKNYLAHIYDANGNTCVRVNAKGEEEYLIKGFDDGERAKEWVDRRLFEGASDWYGEFTHQKITLKGNPWTVRIERSDAIARILKAKKKPVIRQPKTTTSKLSFGVKAVQSRASFSRG